MTSTTDGNRRWEIEHAVDGSDLHPYERLILRVLLSNSDPRTGIIPPKYMPSIQALVKRTGMSRRAVFTHLNALELHGWLVRNTRPGKRTNYQINAPGDDS